MAVVPFLIAGGISLINGLIQGAAAKAAAKEQSKEQQAQATQLRLNLETIRDEMQARKISTDEAMKRIDTVISTTSGNLRMAMENQINVTVANLQGQFDSAIAAQERQLEQLRGTLSEEQEKVRADMQTQLREARENIRRTMVQRRLPGKASSRQLEEAFGERVGETEEQFAKRLTQAEEEAAFQRGQLTAETQRQIAGVQAGGQSQIEQALANLQLQGLGMKSPLEAEQRGFQTSGLQQIMQLESQASALQAASQRDFGTDWLSGFLQGTGGGLGQISGALLGMVGTGEKEKKPVVKTS